MSLPAVRPLTVAEFLARDDGSDVRYELLGGEIVAMAAPSRAHQILAVNFARRLAEALDGRPPCSAGAEAAIALPDRDDTCHIADLAVTCIAYEPLQKLVPSPLVLIEILSPSTEARDRRVKLPDYRGIPSVQEIVLIDQEPFYCEVHRRLDDGRWLTDLLRTPEARLRLVSIGFDQPLSSLYANILPAAG
jgi:Uma2 family endonuclease